MQRSVLVILLICLGGGVSIPQVLYAQVENEPTAVPSPIFRSIINDVQQKLPGGMSMRLPASLEMLDYEGRPIQIYPVVEPYSSGELRVSLYSAPDCQARYCMLGYIAVFEQDSNDDHLNYLRSSPISDPGVVRRSSVDLGSGIRGILATVETRGASSGRYNAVYWEQDNLIFLVSLPYSSHSQNTGINIARSMARSTPIRSTGVEESKAFILHEQGVLSSDSLTLSGDDSYYQIHSFQGRAGQNVTIVMESNEFDPFLALLDSDDQILAQNDDISQTNFNSQISFTLPYTGTYHILANTYDSSGRGNYTLTVTSGQVAYPNPQPPEVGVLSLDQIHESGCSTSLWRVGQSDRNQVVLISFLSDPTYMTIDERLVRFYSLDGRGWQLGERQSSQAFQSEDGQMTLQVNLEAAVQTGYETFAIHGTLQVRKDGQEVDIAVEGEGGC